MHFHLPVMVEEVVTGLVADPRGAYLDATAGGGGHSRAILQTLEPEGRLVAVDRDREAVQETRQALAEFGDRAVVLQGSFGELRQVLEAAQVPHLHGALFDLGVSSHQIDEGGRGFSYQQEGPLDMRMDRQAGASAAAVIAGAAEEELARWIKEYGEERQARRIARSICQVRERGMQTTADLREAVERTRPSHLPKTLARVFQALRITVNDELGQLEQGLGAAEERLVRGGRMAVIAYHSLEDRLVKRRFAERLRGCSCPPAIPVCVCGRQPSFRAVYRKPRRASPDEVRANRRARSAVLRVYERL